MPAFVFQRYIFFRFLFQSSLGKLRWLRTLWVCYCGLEDLNGISYIPNIVSLCAADNQISADNIWNVKNFIQLFKATITNQKRWELAQFLSRTLEQETEGKSNHEKQVHAFSMKFSLECLKCNANASCRVLTWKHKLMPCPPTSSKKFISI